MLFFSILAGISPFLVAFLEDKFKISFLTSSSLTLLNFKLDLEWNFANLILWTLSWFWKVSIILSGFALGSILGGNVCEIIIHDVCHYFFLAYYFVDFYKNHIDRIYTFIGKEWFFGFPDFLLPEILLTLISLKYSFWSGEVV